MGCSGTFRQQDSSKPWNHCRLGLAMSKTPKMHGFIPNQTNKFQVLVPGDPI